MELAQRQQYDLMGRLHLKIFECIAQHWLQYPRLYPLDELVGELLSQTDLHTDHCK